MAKEKKERRISETGGGGKLLPFLLGILAGVLAVGGAVAGVVLYVLKKPMKDTLNLVDGSGKLYETLFDLETGWLDPSYADKRAGDLLVDLMRAADAVSAGGSLSELATISPKVGSTVDSLLEETDKFALPLEKEVLLEKPVDEIFPYVQDSFMAAPLGGLLSGMSGEPIEDGMLLTICYGAPSHYDTVKNEDGSVEYVMKDIVYIYEDKDLTDTDATKKLYDIDGKLVKGSFDYATKTLTVDDGDGDPSNDVVHYLKLLSSENGKETYNVYSDAATEKKLTYSFATVGDLTGDTASLVDDLYLCDVMGLYNTKNTHPVLLSLAYGSENTDYTVDKDGNVKPITTPRTVGELKHENEDLINSILLKDALSVDAGSHSVMLALAYGVKDVDYKIENGKVVEINSPRTIGDLINGGDDLLNDIRLADIMGAKTSSAVNMYILYGRENVHYVLDDAKKPVMLEKKIAVFEDGTESKVYNEYGEPIAGSVDVVNKKYVDGTGTEYQYAPLPTDEKSKHLVKTVKTTDGKVATLYYLQDLDGKSVGKYEPTTLEALSGENNLISNVNTRLTVGELVGKETAGKNTFLKHMQDETISSLPTAVENLTISQVYGDEIYQTNEQGQFVDFLGNPILNEEDYGKRAVKGEWWYLLHDYEHCQSGAEGHETCDGMHCEHNDPECIPNSPGHENCYRNNETCIGDYTIKNMSGLISNMRKNMEIVSLYELHHDGMIDLTLDTMDTEIMSKIVVPGRDPFVINHAPENKDHLGELTVQEMLDYIGGVLTAINQMQQALNRPTTTP